MIALACSAAFPITPTITAPIKICPNPISLAVDSTEPTRISLIIATPIMLRVTKDFFFDHALYNDFSFASPLPFFIGFSSHSCREEYVNKYL
jgi:hypothetical protein